MTHGLRSSPRSTAFLASSPAPIITDGFEVFVQLVIAAITTRPWSTSVSVPSSSVTVTGSATRSSVAAVAVAAARCPGSRAAGRARCRGPRPGGSEAGKDSAFASSTSLPSAFGRALVELGQRLEERVLGVGQRDPVLRALRAGDRGLDLGEVELERLGEGRVLGVLVVEHPLLARVGVDELDQLGRAAGELEVAQRLAVDGEDRAGRAELRRHVADRRPVGEPERGQAGAEELDELRDDAALAQHLGHGQHQVGGGGALAQLAVEPEADHLRQQHRDRLAEHRRLGLDPADAPAEHAEPVDHRRVRVGADERVGVGLRDAVDLALEDDPAQVLEVDLVADPGRRRHDAEVVEGLLAPAQEGVALAVALVVAVGVDVEGARRCRTRRPAPSGR